MQLRRHVLLSLLKLSDIAILMLSLLLVSWVATFMMSQVSLADFLGIRIKIGNVVGLIAMVILWHVLHFAFRLYYSRRLDSFVQECNDILKATTTANVMFLLGGKVFGVSMFTVTFILALWFVSSILTISFRVIMRYALKRVRVKGRNLRFVLIVGTNHRAYAFADAVEKNPDFGYRVAGYVDDVLHTPRPGVELLGGLDDFRKIIRNEVVDEVVVALPLKSQYGKTQEIVEIAEEQGIVTRCLSNIFDTKISKSRATVFAGFPMWEATSGLAHDWVCLGAKWIADMVLGSILIVVTFPAMALAGIAIKLTSPGPILFVQDRLGYNKRIFRLYKFRTMVTGAEKMQKKLEAQNEMDGPVFKIHNDPRVTRVGRWLRKSSIDELPQLFNVLKGDMSLVGPRPLPVRDYQGFSEDWQRRRFSVKPGLTCLWQVHGRNNTSFEHWMKLDMQYIDSWSFFGDMKILYQTIPIVINGKGAS